MGSGLAYIHLQPVEWMHLDLRGLDLEKRTCWYQPNSCPLAERPCSLVDFEKTVTEACQKIQ
ncbi:expressed protein [Batrachochytrium dendrobatidis JAM81]|uniref:Expressed protein n=1 Tax=Batrachochytrium dendrobatidis (strain JAM81 / FGSC 10211) TaxID=684364 RepID=F4NVP6_BATDJ|nr:uncharacterized protein BATDEDRAFT_36460 [Batrachochytrium dendrobatidis JAM81]EGF84120.1 expressed protein [Batrachochytrium dendrobatidis JAM81]|eukprot:XP_006675878.1 expressed protein [Batrachochytrium dendrobatidis JAM81]